MKKRKAPQNTRNNVLSGFLSIFGVFFEGVWGRGAEEELFGFFGGISGLGVLNLYGWSAVSRK